MKTVNIHFQSLPISTWHPADFYLAGNCNTWEPDDIAFRFKANGVESLTLIGKNVFILSV